MKFTSLPRSGLIKVFGRIFHELMWKIGIDALRHPYLRTFFHPAARGADKGSLKKKKSFRFPSIFGVRCSVFDILFGFWSPKAILFVFLIALLFFAGCGSSSTSSPTPGEEKAQPMTYERLWIEQEAAKIPIPEDSGGAAEITRNFYFILDGSGSMSEPANKDCGGDQRFPDKMQGAKWAVKKFLENVPPDVNIGLYVFDNNAKREVVPLGSGNRETFITAVEAIQAGGGTPLARAIRFGADKLIERYKKQLGYGEFRLIVVTDGKAEDIPRACLYAAKYGIPIYAIGLCIGMDHPLRNFSVSYKAADNFSDLSQSLRETLAELPDFDVTSFEEQQ